MAAHTLEHEPTVGIWGRRLAYETSATLSLLKQFLYALLKSLRTGPVDYTYQVRPARTLTNFRYCKFMTKDSWISMSH